MRRRVPLLVASALGMTAGTASGATLFTTGAHTARVTVGATAGLTTSTIARFTSGTSGSTFNTCASSTLGLTLVQNNDTKVILTTTGGTFSGCVPFTPVTPTFSGTSTPWTLTVSGTGTVSGTRTQWGATLDSVSLDYGNGNYRGNYSGLTAFQPSATASPICVAFVAAGSLIGPITGDGRLDTTYCFEGGAAAWSLTN
jgi:hypothetical protein